MSNLTRTYYTASDMPLSWRHWWICFVASLGQLIGTAVATVAGVIIPLLVISAHKEFSSTLQGLIGAADLIGIVIGSVVFGKLSDRYGYLLFFRLCPLLILVFALISIFVPDIPVLIVSLFMIGFGIGGEYSLDSDYVSVLMPTKWSKLMLGLVKTGAALGNIGAAALCLWIIMDMPSADKWSDLMWIIAGIAALMFLTRIYFFESPKWLLYNGRPQEALKALRDFLGDDVELPDELVKSAQQLQSSAPASNVTPAVNKDDVASINGVTSANEEKSGSAKVSNIGFIAFCRKYFDRVMLSGVPWACEGLGVYGIGVFIPILVMALGIEHQSDFASQLSRVAESVRTTLWISLIILPGFLIGIYLTYRKFKETTLQTINFWACALSLVVLLLSYHYGWAKWISLLAFMGFELFLNIGPHLVTYLLPPKIYPVDIRGQGTGIAASLGKVGAVAGVFLIPLLLKWGGGVLVLAVSAAVMALGAIITSCYGARVLKNV